MTVDCCLAVRMLELSQFLLSESAVWACNNRVFTCIHHTWMLVTNSKDKESVRQIETDRVKINFFTMEMDVIRIDNRILDLYHVLCSEYVLIESMI